MFLQQCHICGRRLEVQVRHLGRPVQCPHCRCTFTATNSKASTAPTTDDSVDQVLRDAEIYLASVEEINEVATAWENQQPAER